MLKKYIQNEIALYLFFGGLTTIVYLVSRSITFFLLPNATVSATISNITAILFAFFTNDRFVFKQSRVGKYQRLKSFVLARLFTLGLDLLMAFIFVEKFPEIIGQFVQNIPHRINNVEGLISQILIIILNYVLSKLFVFKDKQPH
ncbi:TPA: GtrA family protein [Streptococcus agalactiae]|nr:GtrA family protein [Streptococcus agalactiae]HEO4177388.1 GtrA family protein [Streptococcus agalactiae]